MCVRALMLDEEMRHEVEIGDRHDENIHAYIWVNI